MVIKSHSDLQSIRVTRRKLMLVQSSHRRRAPVGVEDVVWVLLRETGPIAGCWRPEAFGVVRRCSAGSCRSARKDFLIGRVLLHDRHSRWGLLQRQLPVGGFRYLWSEAAQPAALSLSRHDRSSGPVCAKSSNVLRGFDLSAAACGALPSASRQQEADGGFHSMTSGLCAEAEICRCTRAFGQCIEEWMKVTAHTHRVRRPVYGRVTARSCTIKSGVSRRLLYISDSKVR